jgi:tetratricopeptide (TPR) repeat protein
MKDSSPKIIQLSQARLQTWAWIVLLLLAGGTAIAHLTFNPFWRQWSAASNTGPYRYPFSTQLPGNTKPVLGLQEEIAFYQRRVQIDPKSGLNLASLAQAYYKMGKAVGQGHWYLLAEQSAQRSLATLPFDNSGAILVLARVREAEHQFQSALQLAGDVLKQQPDDPEALAIVVTCHLATGNYQQAEAEAQKITNQHRGIGSLTLLALAKANLGHDQEAIRLFQEAINVEAPGELGSSAWTRTLLGRFHAQRGQLKQAEHLYQEALRIIPRYPLALIQQADLELRQGDYKAAEHLYNQVISDSSNNTTVFDHLVLRRLARTYGLQGNLAMQKSLFDRAEAMLRQEAVGHAGGSFGHRRELAQLLLERGRSSDRNEALTLMREDLKIRRDTETLDTLAWALMQSGQPQAARKVLQEVLDRGTRDAIVLYRAGVLEQQLGNSTVAKQLFQRSRAVDPTLTATTRQFVGL